MANKRPPVYTRCEHDGRPGEVRATYPTKNGIAVVGLYLDRPADLSAKTHFCCPWADCKPEALAA